MKKRIIFLVICMFIFAAAMMGCANKSISVMDITKKETGKISRSAKYWSGISKDKIIIKEEDKTINFSVDMKKGNITFSIKDENDKEVYVLTKNGECKEKDSFTIEKSGTYFIAEKAEDFEGSYEITWDDENKDISAEKSDVQKTGNK